MPQYLNKKGLRVDNKQVINEIYVKKINQYGPWRDQGPLKFAAQCPSDSVGGGGHKILMKPYLTPFWYSKLVDGYIWARYEISKKNWLNAKIVDSMKLLAIRQEIYIFFV